MFTGLVETIGTVTSLLPLDSTSSGGSGTSLTISTPADPTFLADAALGDSISVNGTCLTITELPPSTSTSSPPSWFKVGIAPETLRRTNLGALTQHARVNLERAVSASTRMGGHFVQGHVDAVATVLAVTPDGNALTFRLRIDQPSTGETPDPSPNDTTSRSGPGPASLMKYIVEKGYITLDGASLTVTAVNDAESWFEVMLIAYTQERIVTGSKQPGDQVNVEIDVVGKYVEKSVGAYFERAVGEYEAATAAAGGQGGRGAVAGSGGVTTGTPAILEKMVRRIVEERLAEGTR